MIKNLGVGIDVVDIMRFQMMPYKTKISFYKKIFDQSEINYCLTHKNPAPHFAGKFAIKEALIKSVSERIQMRDIKTIHKSSKPKIILQKKLPYNFIISVTHDGNIAMAIVISERIK